jgi:hypothetical protein
MTNETAPAEKGFPLGLLFSENIERIAFDKKYLEKQIPAEPDGKGIALRRIDDVNDII